MALELVEQHYKRALATTELPAAYLKQLIPDLVTVIFWTPYQVAALSRGPEGWPQGISYLYPMHPLIYIVTTYYYLDGRYRTERWAQLPGTSGTLNEGPQGSLGTNIQHC